MNFAHSPLAPQRVTITDFLDTVMDITIMFLAK